MQASLPPSPVQAPRAQSPRLAAPVPTVAMQAYTPTQLQAAVAKLVQTPVLTLISPPTPAPTPELVSSTQAVTAPVQEGILLSGGHQQAQQSLVAVSTSTDMNTSSHTLNHSGSDQSDQDNTLLSACDNLAPAPGTSLPSQGATNAPPVTVDQSSATLLSTVQLPAGLPGACSTPMLLKCVHTTASAGGLSFELTDPDSADEDTQPLSGSQRSVTTRSASRRRASQSSLHTSS